MSAPRPPPSKPLDLDITIVSAKHLKNVNWRHGDLKPYAIFWLDPNRRLATKADDSGSTSPVWNERFLIPINNFPANDSVVLTLEVFHSKPLDTPKPLVGTLRFALEDLVDSDDSSKLRTFELRRPSGRPQGKIRIKVAIRERPDHDYHIAPQPNYYYSTAPPPPPRYSTAPQPPAPYTSSVPPPPAPYTSSVPPHPAPAASPPLDYRGYSTVSPAPAPYTSSVPPHPAPYASSVPPSSVPPHPATYTSSFPPPAQAPYNSSVPLPPPAVSSPPLPSHPYSYGSYTEPYPSYYPVYYSNLAPFNRQSSYGGGPSAPVDYAPYDQKPKSGNMGLGTGLAVGAVAGAVAGIALEEGLKYEEEKIADRVERDMASRDDYRDYRGDEY